MDNINPLEFIQGAVNQTICSAMDASKQVLFGHWDIAGTAQPEAIVPDESTVSQISEVSIFEHLDRFRVFKLWFGLLAFVMVNTMPFKNARNVGFWSYFEYILLAVSLDILTAGYNFEIQPVPMCASRAVQNIHAAWPHWMLQNLLKPVDLALHEVCELQQTCLIEICTKLASMIVDMSMYCFKPAFEESVQQMLQNNAPTAIVILTQAQIHTVWIAADFYQMLILSETKSFMCKSFTLVRFVYQIANDCNKHMFARGRIYNIKLRFKEDRAFLLSMFKNAVQMRLHFNITNGDSARAQEQWKRDKDAETLIQFEQLERNMGLRQAPPGANNKRRLVATVFCCLTNLWRQCCFACQTLYEQVCFVLTDDESSSESCDSDEEILSDSEIELAQ